MDILLSLICSITGYLVNINFKTVGYFGFGAGFASASLCSTGAYYISRYFYIKPEDVFSASLKQISANGDVLRMMGENLVPGLYIMFVCVYAYKLS